jgi:hypothetical protein
MTSNGQRERMQHVGAATLSSGPGAPALARGLVAGWLADHADRRVVETRSCSSRSSSRTACGTAASRAARRSSCAPP